MRRKALLAIPLFRLLAINLAIGMALAVLMVSGLLLLNPYNLRSLIANDPSGAIVGVLLLFGFIITFGSTAMGTAIMAIGGDDDPRGGKRQDLRDPLPAAEPALVKVTAR